MDEEIKKLLEQNLKLTQEIYTMTKKIRRYLAWQRLVSFFYLIIIVAPIILGIIYLPPLLRSVYNQYKGLLGVQAGTTNPIQSLINGASGNLNNVNLNGLPPQIKALINK